MAPPSAIYGTSADASLAHARFNVAATPHAPNMTPEMPLGEAVTNLSNGHVPERLFEEASSYFSERELCDLPLAVATINAWNRLSISARLVPGGYQPAKRPEMVTQA